MARLIFDFSTYLCVIERVIELSKKLKLSITEDDPTVTEFYDLKQYLLSFSVDESKKSVSKIETKPRKIELVTEKYYTTVYYNCGKSVIKDDIEILVMYPSDVVIAADKVRLTCDKPMSKNIQMEVHALFRCLEIQYANGFTNYKSFQTWRGEQNMKDSQYLCDKIVSNDTGLMTGIIGILSWSLTVEKREQ